ncbi:MULTISPECIES: LPS export ABC transporter periplasmic protein LptC [Dyella]|uniref:LPS export ABC transporter periplasmic protein LptC n=2 Tax=Dyella TaxID=231454 RepID=A0A4R0YRW6_9GAMM|nr:MULTISPECIES: LPS export ABC transporter periplasmic protein LptC [Dyella]TBR37133.1 LPS export ABC transporter periplasmic protein LptC [Dyella terrae]TCI07777.1 LPS export ABC transporter periplasmic protein LptC [Dyella soli]
MSLRDYFRDNRLQVGIVVLGVALVATQLLRWWIAPEPKANEFVGPPRSGYSLINFKGFVYDQEGLPSFRVYGPRLDRREGDESLYIDQPRFELPSKKPGVPAWQGESVYGWVDKSGTLLKLQGQVYMHRPAYGDTAQAELHTSEVTAWPKENRMETAEAATMTQGDTTMRGIGMRANLTDNHLELLDDSHGSFPPRKRKS